MQTNSIFDFVVKNSKGEDVSLQSFSNKKGLILVNVASACGLTDSNYKELVELYATY